jgi:hypothetical protein
MKRLLLYFFPMHAPSARARRRARRRVMLRSQMAHQLR